ncbi:hypothetical protein ACQP1O_23405 [Nocardia sp. CA-151230]|uniref:hypothetical protein n=1 Tax=Nocardia sp. CA-151230 TaxID=3239982 RepID=UPI003D8DBE12
MTNDVPVTEQRTDGRLTWQVWAGPANPVITENHPGEDILMTRVTITGPGVNEGWGFGGRPLYTGKTIDCLNSRCEDGTEFILARFEPTLPAIHLETTRRTITVDVRKLPTHFGLKFWAQPIDRGEEFVTAYGNQSEYRPLGWTPVH